MHTASPDEPEATNLAPVRSLRPEGPFFAHATDGYVVFAAGVATVDFVDPTKAGKAIDWDAPLGKGQRPANGAPNSAIQGQQTAMLQWEVAHHRCPCLLAPVACLCADAICCSAGH